MSYHKFTFCLFVLIFVPFAQAEWKVGEPFIGLADFALRGEKPDLADQVILIDFWATWCAPCKASFPHLDSLEKEFSSSGFSVVGISVDRKYDALEKWKDRRPVSFSILWDEKQKLVANAGIQAMPTSFLIDREGIIRYQHEGFREGDEKELRKLIQTLLEE